MWLLDTNAAIHLRDGNEAVERKVATLQGELFLSVISFVELQGGLYRDLTQTERMRARLDAIIESVTILTFRADEAERYGEIVKHAGYSRPKLLDRMIAAQAILAHATLITMNGEDFRDIPGLTLEIWPSPQRWPNPLV
jgi:predicted nucleic acid-binding protein